MGIMTTANIIAAPEGEQKAVPAVDLSRIANLIRLCEYIEASVTELKRQLQHEADGDGRPTREVSE